MITIPSIITITYNGLTRDRANEHSPPFLHTDLSYHGLSDGGMRKSSQGSLWKTSPPGCLKSLPGSDSNLDWK